MHTKYQPSLVSRFQISSSGAHKDLKIMCVVSTFSKPVGLVKEWTLKQLNQKQISILHLIFFRVTVLL